MGFVCVETLGGMLSWSPFTSMRPLNLFQVGDFGFLEIKFRNYIMLVRFSFPNIELTGLLMFHPLNLCNLWDTRALISLGLNVVLGSTISALKEYLFFCLRLWFENAASIFLQ